MIVPLIGLAVLFAGGVWLVAGALWPPRPALADALARAYRPAVRLDTSAAPGWAGRVGRWALRRLRSALMIDDATRADLEITRRLPEEYAASCVIAALVGTAVGPVAWAVSAAAGLPIPLVLPMWLVIAGAAAGWWVPRVSLRAGAATARRDARHAVGAYLDVLVLLLAAQEGPESAMAIAAAAGTGPTFEELRRAVDEARLSGDPVWDRLDELGMRIGVIELREIAAAGSLAGESGASVRRSLTAKARSLRAAGLAEAEAQARRDSQSMFAPLTLMGLGFILFIVYPLLADLSFGAPP